MTLLLRFGGGGREATADFVTQLLRLPLPRGLIGHPPSATLPPTFREAQFRIDGSLDGFVAC